jgi:hypothetical protein
MSNHAAIERFFLQILREYDGHIRASGAYDQRARYPLPDLSNDIIPMFKDRWLTGPGQHTSEIIYAIKPALKLASRLLTEEFPLRWFAHLTFGERRRKPTGQVYIVPTPKSLSAEAIDEVKENIRNVGKLVTFMWDPHGRCCNDAHGLTLNAKEGLDSYREFQQSDWPPTHRPARPGYARPLVVINRGFQDYFLGNMQLSQDEEYRVLLMLAVTLVHEFTHAYNFWLSPDRHEPCWSISEKDSELGWSWEHMVMGYGLQPLSVPGGGYQNLFLLQFKVLEYRSMSERDRVMTQLTGSNRTDGMFTKVNASGRTAVPPVIDANEFRYSEWYLGDDRRVHSYMAAAQVIPMNWVVSWFSEATWRERRAHWRQQNAYVRPSLGKAFTLLYERSGNHTGTFRPLYPAFPVDKDILDRRARGDYSR